MELFRTEIEIPQAAQQINYHNKILMLGSCFSDNISSRLQRLKFEIINNPAGIVYNPISIAIFLNRIIQGENFKKEDIEFYNEQWFSYMHHGSYSDIDQENCLNQINTDFNHASQQLPKTDWLFITLGSAWLYRLKSNGMVVSNCHKIPATNFVREMATVAQIVDIFTEVIHLLNIIQPAIKIVFTISPVRHLKDSAVGNHLSKSVLMLAIHELMANNKNIEYFPAYEIFMDELRDYRFYADDMIHPSDTAVNFVWNKFINCYIDAESKQIIQKIEEIVRAEEHRPFNINTIQHKVFVEKNQQKKTALLRSYPFLNW